MTQFYDMIMKNSLKTHGVLKKYSERLRDCLNISQFYYYTLSNDGYLGVCDSHISWAECFGSELYSSYPFYCHPKYSEQGLELIKDPYSQHLEKVVSTGKEQFNFRSWLRIMKKTPEGIEEFGFHSTSDSHAQDAIFINGVGLLEIFIKKFKQENKREFYCVEENKVNIANILGDAFFKKQVSGFPSQLSKEKMLQLLGIQVDSPLNARDLRVLEELLNGLPASKIASRVHLSKRTVEHRIDTIKEKLSCSSKSELVQKAREMDRLGLLHL